MTLEGYSANSIVKTITTKEDIYGNIFFLIALTNLTFNQANLLALDFIYKTTIMTKMQEKYMIKSVFFKFYFSYGGLCTPKRHSPSPALWGVGFGDTVIPTLRPPDVLKS